MISRSEIKGDKRLALVIGKMEKGCELCFPGLKAVIFVTGICGDNCYYCPISKERFGKDLIYINEEKVSSLEPNASALISRGLNEDERRPFTAKGSIEAAMKVLEWAKLNSNIYVHFCPASFKDSVQTKNRFIRLAKNDKRWYEEITSYGTIIWGEVNINDKIIRFNPKNMNLYKGYSVKILESHPTRSRIPIISEETIDI